MNSVSIKMTKKTVFDNRTALYVTSRQEWRAWLEKNHAGKIEIWLVFYKKHAGVRSIPYEEAVEEALCFGWIDSLVKKVDDERYIQKFTPRKKNSTWSALNKKRVRKLIRHGRMKVIQESKKNGSWTKLDRVESLHTMPPDLAKAFAARAELRKAFKKLMPTAKKQFLWWIESAKRGETRSRRIRETVRLVSKGKTMSDYFYSREN
jgi:uncharacterized protein YdeI (YjbR/CyaY-like superfamily)